MGRYNNLLVRKHGVCCNAVPILTSLQSISVVSLLPFDYPAPPPKMTFLSFSASLQISQIRLHADECIKHMPIFELSQMNILPAPGTDRSVILQVSAARLGFAIRRTAFYTSNLQVTVHVTFTDGFGCGSNLQLAKCLLPVRNAVDRIAPPPPLDVRLQVPDAVGHAVLRRRPSTGAR